MNKIIIFTLPILLFGLLFLPIESSILADDFVARNIEAAALSKHKGALVDEIVFTLERDPGKVAGLIESGSYHVFTQSITNTTIFNRLRDSIKADYEMAYGFSVELTLNPAPFNNDRLNPFQVSEIREAINWLIDRNYIVDEIYGGLAAARYLPLNTTFPDYARLAEAARGLELYYRHNPQRAAEVIEKEMIKLGAEKKNGRWIYNKKHVEIIVLIRSDDVRKRVGDYVGNLMEDLGFKVTRLYRTAEESSRIWVVTDPAEGQWHIYTGAWASTVINRDLSGNFSFYYTPRGRPYPLWQAYKPSEEFDKLADRLERGDYRSWEERQQMMAEALELSMLMSTRVWVVDQISIAPRAAEISLAADLAGGISGSRLYPYTLRFANKLGGRVVFATPNVLVEPWNPIVGSNWLFDTMIMRALDDPPFLPDPFTGLYLPQRVTAAELTIVKDVLVEKTHDWVSINEVTEVNVSEDAIIGWDHKQQRFIKVKEAYSEGLTAKLKARIIFEDNFLNRKWHDGSKVSLADIILGWILIFERAAEESPYYDESYIPSFELFKKHFKGWQIVSESPLTIDIFGDQIFPDAEMIAALRTPTTIPWHAVALGLKAEAAGRLAFSSHKADSAGIDWLSMIAGPSLKILEGYLDSAATESYLPFAKALSPYVTKEDIVNRYENLKNWHKERKHFWVGDGPFYLHAVYPIERAVVLRRFAEFPDYGDKWLNFSAAEIPELDISGPIVVRTGEDISFKLSATFRGKPYPLNSVDKVQYLLFDGSGRLKLKGYLELVKEGQWSLKFTGDMLKDLQIGANSLEIAFISKSVALPSFVSHAFATLPAESDILPQISPENEENNL